MVIWRIEGNEIGPNGNGARYLPTKADAMAALREYREDVEDRNEGSGPYKVTVKDRESLCEELNAAMGYGCS